MQINYLISFSALCLMTSLALFTSDIYLSAFPLIAQSLNVDQDLVKLSLSFYLLGLCLCQLSVGYLIGIINKYQLSMTAIGVFFLSSLFIMFSDSIYMIYFLRFIQAFSAGVLTSTSRIIISQRSVRDEESSGFFAKVYLSLGIAPLISPIIGSLIAGYSSWRNIFLFLALLGLTMVYFVFYLKKHDAHHHLTQKIPFKKLLTMYKELLSRKLFIKNALIIGSSFVIYFTFLCQAPFILNSLGLSVIYIGLLFVPISLAYIVASLWHSSLVRKIGVEKLLDYGVKIFMLGSIGLVIASLVTTQAYWMLLPMCIMTFSNGFLVPAATFSAMKSAIDMPAAATSLLGFIQLLPPILGTILLAVLQVKTIVGVSLITLILPMLLLLIPTFMDILRRHFPLKPMDQVRIIFKRLLLRT